MRDPTPSCCTQPWGLLFRLWLVLVFPGLGMALVALILKRPALYTRRRTLVVAFVRLVRCVTGLAIIPLNPAGSGGIERNAAKGLMSKVRRIRKGLIFPQARSILDSVLLRTMSFKARGDKEGGRGTRLEAGPGQAEEGQEL